MKMWDSARSNEAARIEKHLNDVCLCIIEGIVMKTRVKIRAVIWDLDGVIIRTENLSPRSKQANRLGITRKELEWMAFSSESARQAELGEISVDTHWHNLQQALQLNPSDLRSLKYEFWAGDHLDHNLMKFIRAMRIDFRTALVSNAWLDSRQAIIRRWCIGDAFDEIIISAEVGLRKPDQRIFDLATKKLGVIPEEAVLVDDCEDNIAAAEEAGLKAICFHDPAQIGTELLELLKEPVE
jgi:epoxide hydrolase-like predicted phosphatase